MARFYLDENLGRDIAQGLVQRGHTVFTTEDLRAKGSPDPIQLLIAVRQNATLITYNGQDFRMLQIAWKAWSDLWGVTPGHPGILVLPPGPADQACQRVDDFVQSGLDATTALYYFDARLGWQLFTP